MDKLLPFIIKRASCTYVKGYDMDDLIQLGRVSVIKAVIKYDFNKNSKFSSYAMGAVKKNFYNLIRNNKKYGSCCSLNTVQDNGLELQDSIASSDNVEDFILKKETIKFLNEALQQLKKEEEEIIKWFFFQKKTLQSYSKEKGICYKTVLDRKNRALKKLRKFMKSKS